MNTSSEILVLSGDPTLVADLSDALDESFGARVTAAESMMMVCCRVIGNDAVVTTSALGGIGSLFELNVAMPVMIDAFMESVKLLANVANVFTDKLLVGLQVNADRCKSLIDESLEGVERTILFNLSGHGHFDMAAYDSYLSGKLVDLALDDAELERAWRAIEGLPAAV